MASSAPLSNFHGSWRLFLFKSLAGNSVLEPKQGCYYSICFVLVLYHCGKWGCSPLPPLKCLLFCDCSKGLRWAPTFLLVLFVSTLWQGESVPLIVLWHFHLFWEALLHFKDILARFSFAQLQIAVGICSASLMTSSLRTFEIMSVCLNSAFCSASCCSFPGTPSGCSGALLLGLFCLLGWSCWLWLVFSGFPLDLGAARCHSKVTFGAFIKPFKS